MNETIEIYTADGIELKIFSRNDQKLPFGFRYYDLDSGNTVGVIHCPTLELAQKEFTKCKNVLLGVLPPNVQIPV